jgi:molybdate transport system substrate-binding protein
MRTLTVALAMAVIAGPAAADTVLLYAAGSLRGALTDVAKAFEATSGDTVQAKFGASGLLKDEIAGGAQG